MRVLGMAVALCALPGIASWSTSCPLGSVCTAAQPPARYDGAHPAVARIIVQLRDGMAYGSGTLVGANDQHGLVVTNWHVVRDAAGPIFTVFPDGFRSSASVLRVDRDWDLAALAIWRPPAVAPVPITPYATRPGEPLTIAGYGSGWYRAATGACVQYVSPETNLPPQMIEMAVPARQGDSGGPMFNARGEVAGVLFGTGGGHTLGSYGGRVRAFLEPALAEFRRLNSNPQYVAQRRQPDVPPAIGVPPATVTAPAVVVKEPPKAATPVSPPPLVATLPVEKPRPTVVEPRAEVPVEAPRARPEAVVTREKNRRVAPQAPPPQVAYVPPIPAASPAEPTPQPAAVAANGGETQLPMLTWTDVAGTTRGEQTKTILAAIGVLALVIRVLHFFAHGDPPKKRRASAKHA